MSSLLPLLHFSSSPLMQVMQLHLSPVETSLLSWSSGLIRGAQRNATTAREAPAPAERRHGSHRPHA